ncbi:MAG: hypothetical protein J2P47_03260 [Acetobacteraceae bacterium]|nr:hypothetical protein [Acetobacteraceae bacterium]
MDPTERDGSRREFWAGVRGITPLAICVAIYGLAFGLLAVQAGLGAVGVGVRGAAVFAGARRSSQHSG